MGDTTIRGRVGTSQPHESADLHVSGEARYTDDIPEPQGTLHAAIGVSSKAHARIKGIDTAAARLQRGLIARIGIDLVGMTEDPDNDYVDPDETVASARNHRKFAVEGDVTPRNFGMKGQRDLFVDVNDQPVGVAQHLIQIFLDRRDRPVGRLNCRARCRQRALEFVE